MIEARQAGGRDLPRVNYLTFSEAGHRAEFDVALIALMRERGVEMRPGAGDAVADFYPILDDSIAGFVARGLRNAFQGRKTVGLFFRPRQCFLRTRLKYRFKGLLFKLIRRIPGVSVLTIMPFPVEPRAAGYASGWINCPMSWDLPYSTSPSLGESSGLVEQMHARAAGRRILVTLGRQDEEKGFAYLSRVWCSSAALRDAFLFVSAGKVAAECADAARAFAADGGMLIDRRISDEELRELYTGADMVWASYAESYDQASGIFGRSVQYGVPTVVRKGAYLAALGPYLDHPVLPVSWQSPEQAAARIADWRPTRPDRAAVDAKVTAIREADVATLLAAMGLAGR